MALLFPFAPGSCPNSRSKIPLPQTQLKDPTAQAHPPSEITPRPPTKAPVKTRQSSTSLTADFPLCTLIPTPIPQNKTHAPAASTLVFSKSNSVPSAVST